METNIYIDETIYSTEEFKKHDAITFPIIKDICLRFVFQKEHELLVRTLSLHKSLEETKQIFDKGGLSLMIENFIIDAPNYLSKDHSYDKNHINGLITDFIPNDISIKRQIEKRKSDLQEYCDRENISKDIRETYLKVIEQQKRKILVA